MIRKAIRMIIIVAMRSIFLNPNFTYYDLLFYFIASLCNKNTSSDISRTSTFITLPEGQGRETEKQKVFL